MYSSFLICDFAKETLSNLVRVRFGDNFPDIIKKKQINYLFHYLTDLEAKSILLETEYIDKDYLEDYSRYYLKCFSRYGERCARLHFFSSDVDHSKIRNGLEENPSEFQRDLQKSYLGFVVLKPLPKTFIGKTCLKVYPSLISKPTKKVIHKKYTVNLFGISLSVDSIAFQEQDKVVSACATTAIWTLLHAQRMRHLDSVPSSSEITLSAINHIKNSTNSFPNAGLSNKQIARAFDIYKLRHHKINFEGSKIISLLKDLIKYHINSDIPLLLGAEVFAKGKGGDADAFIGSHAVTILGYEEDGTEFSLYIHDDQFGPYAKAKLSQITTCPDDKELSCAIFLQEKIDGEWLDSEQYLVPFDLFIPTHPKVRIPSTCIRNTCFLIAEEYKVNWPSEETLGSFSFDIKLNTLSEYRAEVLRNKAFINRYDIVTKNSARFLWVANFYDSSDNDLVMSIAFDATDIPHGKSILHIAYTNEPFYKSLGFAFDKYDSLNLPMEGMDNFFQSFIQFLREKKEDYRNYLDAQYGEPRAPKKIKSHEVNANNLGEIPLERFYGTRKGLRIEQYLNAENNIWAIALDGALLIGKEVNDMGHPCLTGFESARVAGEIHIIDGVVTINGKSGRFSTDYSNVNTLVENALNRFREIFPDDEVKCSLYDVSDSV